MARRVAVMGSSGLSRVRLASRSAEKIGSHDGSLRQAQERTWVGLWRRTVWVIPCPGAAPHPPKVAWFHPTQPNSLPRVFADPPLQKAKRARMVALTVNG